MGIAPKKSANQNSYKVLTETIKKLLQLGVFKNYGKISLDIGHTCDANSKIQANSCAKELCGNSV